MGFTPDISSFLQFEFYEPIYYFDEFNSGFPFSKEKLGRWLGPTENCGDAMTFFILTDDTNEIIARSSVRSAKVAVNGTYNLPVNLRPLLDKDDEDTTKSKNILYDPSVSEGSDLIVVPGSGLDDLPLEAPPLPTAPDHTPERFKFLRDEIKKAEGQAVGL